MVHVGDSYEHDMVGAKAVGMRTVWVPLPGQGEADEQGAADAVIHNLHGLAAVLDAWQARG